MHAFGQPGIASTWTSSAKDMVGCSLGPARSWFTAGYGIANEAYSPRVDIPQIGDRGFIVADDEGFWVEVKRLDSYRVEHPQPGVPALEIVHLHEHFELRLRIAELDAMENDLDLFVAELPSSPLKHGQTLRFTIFRTASSSREQHDHELRAR